ncbi:MAG: DUF5698 domain-containing protein [Candidatus Izimaplasma sp.]|nr:DUF5698 domain-containing protein [Candidatus Izimaplasma bacterium]
MDAIVLYFLIFIIKVFEVSISTLRIVLITKDERLKGSIIAFFEVVLWLLIITAVLKDITEDPFKVVVYALGFAVGNYLGSWLENYLGTGNASVEVICKRSDAKIITKALRENGHGVTSVSAKGMRTAREILLLYISRKEIQKTVKQIQAINKDVVITIHDIKPIYGGYHLFRK